MLVSQREQIKKELPYILNQVYGFTPDMVDVLGWGYTSVAFYVEHTGKKYVARLNLHSTEEEMGLQKEVYLSNLLNNKIPTTRYVKTLSDTFLSILDGRILRLSEYIAGTAPFDMKVESLKEACKCLRKIHQVDLDEIKMSHHLFKSDKFNNITLEQTKLLHGDLTPSNIVVADDKVVGVLDFAFACFGPKEWDLAHTIIFSWFRIKDKSCIEIYESAINSYNDDQINKEMLYKYACENIESHISNITKNEKNYDNKEFFRDDYNFASNKYQELKSIRF